MPQEALRQQNIKRKDEGDLIGLSKGLLQVKEDDCFGFWGFSTFSKYVAADLGLKSRISLYYVSVAKFMRSMEISDELAEAIGWVKLVDWTRVPVEQARENIVLFGKAEENDTSRFVPAGGYEAHPFTLLNSNDGEWQRRKKAWLDKGVHSEFDMKDRTTHQALMPAQTGSVQNSVSTANTGYSVFDPVVCELMYSWFCPKHGRIFDPFAGGSVRGLVASRLGYSYIGFDLSDAQVGANKQHARKFDIPQPTWSVCDSSRSGVVTKDMFDFVFSCPPYVGLEKYTEDPRDLSTMDYRPFLVAYEAAIGNAVQSLAQNRFACFVVGDVRASDGHYYGFIADTIKAFERQGAYLYNEFILVTKYGSGAMRLKRQFGSSRKAVKVHQNILVFIKGDPQMATLGVQAS